MKSGKALICPSCGAPVNIRFPGKTQTVSCQNCFSIIDSTHETLKLIAAYKSKEEYTPVIPLGSQGYFEDINFEITGFLVKQDGDGNIWHEYLLFNPYAGYRYLAVWQNHWSYINIENGIPEISEGVPLDLFDYEKTIAYEKNRYKYFATYTATVLYAIGEFNYKVNRGDETTVYDYINPPFILSCEIDKNSNELVWSHGEYQLPGTIFSVFHLEKPTDEPFGIAPNQINYYSKIRKGIWKIALSLTILSIFLASGLRASFENNLVYSKVHEVNIPFSNSQGQQFQYEFQIKDIVIPNKNPTENLYIDVKTEDLANTWNQLVFYLLNEENGKGYAFSVETEYYSGYSDGEFWSEDKRSNSVLTTGINPGTYVVMVTGLTNHLRLQKIQIQITRDVLDYAWMWIFLAVLWLPIIYYMYTSYHFEQERMNI